MTPENLKSIRKDILGLKQYELAEILGLGPQMISNYERGTHQIPKTVQYALFWLAVFGPGNPQHKDWRPRFIGKAE